MHAIPHVAETEPRISLSGVVLGITVALGALTFSARLVSPLALPGEPENLIAFTSWWLAAVLNGWLALSLVTWLAVLGRPSVPSPRWLRIITVPGSKKLAEALLAVSVLVGPAAACSPGAVEVQAPRLEVLSSGQDVPTGSNADTTTIPSSSLPLFPETSVGELLVDTTGPRAAGRASTPLETAVVDPRESASATAGVGTLADAPPAPLVADTNAEPATAAGEASSPAAGTGPVVQDETPPSASEEPPAGGEQVQPAPHVVTSGENFWSIARAHLHTVTGSEPSNAEIATYWHRLIETNRATIRSANPDLIFPGEVLVLPSPGE